MPRRKPLFLTDSMLGKLCRWLRILGFKCVSASEVAAQASPGKDKNKNPGKGNAKKSFAAPDEGNDETLLKACLKLNAVLLTRDEAFFQRAQDYVKTVLVKSNSLEEQAAFVLNKFNLSVPLRPKQTFCPACGSVLERVKKESVREKVFPRVFERQKRFWLCPSCNSLYWKGTHWEKILETGMKIGAAVARLQK